MRYSCQSLDGVAKFWLMPSIELARSVGLSWSKIKEAERIVEAHQQEIITLYPDAY
jgi:hypothetical protein